MIKLDKKEIIKRAKEDEIKFIQMHFSDILGILKSVNIPVSALDSAIDNGVIFDGSSVVGYATIDESDMRLFPDLDTYLVLPWTEKEQRTARFICDVHYSNGKPFEGDPRYRLKKVLKKAKKMGFTFYTGPEYEFFLFKLHENKIIPEPCDHGGYFDLLPIERGEVVVNEIVNYLNEMKFNVECQHHEVSSGQFEIDLHYSDALTIADRISMLKYAIKIIAAKNGLYATFLPKPIFGKNGSGMHVHQSLFIDGKNIFYDPKGRFGGLSETALQYIAGQLTYAKEICGILASWANSYKRLVPGYEAPVYISWANLNRSALIRIPGDREEKTRIELRNPDSAGNPYLQFTVMLASGLKGIEEQIKIPFPEEIPQENIKNETSKNLSNNKFLSPVQKNIYKMKPEERKREGIEPLPSNLGEALSHMETGTLVKEALGEVLLSHFLKVKTKEWEEYRAQLTEWELNKYLPII